MYNNILISVVVFNKSIADIPIIFELLSSDINVELIIYDNSTDPIIAESNNLNHKHLMYYHDENNSGVSQAYNHSFEYALSSNKSAVLILDQDTYFLLSNLDDYINAFNEYGDTFIYAPIVCDKNKSKIYSPATLKNFIGHCSHYKKFNLPKLQDINGISVINSGLFIPVTIFEKVGGYNPNIKLDFSDVYFIEKYKEGNRNLVLVDVELNHSLSGDEGMNRVAELSRFKFYCEGAAELAISLHKSTLWSVIRRMLRLNIKYLSFMPISIFFNYYVLRKKT
ncbi:glycosyltransferase [Aliivibrio salmonicida]|uniref:Glycosyltransferase n=2 Tax=Aliivibrio salmonicida TaxID=40269 RepID=B6EHD3_ALISL|nr:glycosyltransferase [Aliivibrio salmonicida]CAQ80710.1 putative glycosyltransferase [Aliivibrio salmonicida LFI1238]